MTNLGNKNIFTKNLKMYMEQFGKNQKEMADLVQKINCTKKELFFKFFLSFWFCIRKIKLISFILKF